MDDGLVLSILTRLPELLERSFLYPGSMKVIHLSSVRLVLKETLIGLRIISFFTTLTGFYIFISFEPPVDLFGGFCIAIASLINVLSPTEICTFDKTLDRITFHRLRVFTKQISHYRISAIDEIAVEQKSLWGTPFYRVKLSLNSGEKIAVTQSGSTDMQAQTKLAKEISRFIHFRRSKPEIYQPIPEEKVS